MKEMNSSDQKKKICGIIVKCGLFFMAFLIITVLVPSCHTMFVRHQSQQESCEECRYHTIRLYTITDTDTFFYSPAYTSHAYADGLLVFEKHGEIAHIRMIQNNRPNGMYIKFYPSGNIEQEGVFVQGRREGVFLSYNDTDTKCISMITIYMNGEVKHNHQLKSPICLDD